MTPVLRYIELKSGHGDSGPAWIALVLMSRTGATVYFDDRALKRMKSGGISGNYVDFESGEEFWVSGVKKNGADRHWAGSGRVFVERVAVPEYLAARGMEKLDPEHHEITDDVKPTNIQRFAVLENRYDGQEEDDAV
jgi:hypothetical protein